MFSLSPFSHTLALPPGGSLLFLIDDARQGLADLGGPCGGHWQWGFLTVLWVTLGSWSLLCICGQSWASVSASPPVVGRSPLFGVDIGLLSGLLPCFHLSQKACECELTVSGVPDSSSRTPKPTLRARARSGRPLLKELEAWSAVKVGEPPWNPSPLFSRLTYPLYASNSLFPHGDFSSPGSHLFIMSILKNQLWDWITEGHRSPAQDPPEMSLKGIQQLWEGHVLF